jgi:hypothetical protein
MNTNKKILSYRAFVSVMAGLMGIILPISGLILHAYSDHRIIVGKHLWFTVHVFAGIIFLGFVVWHIILNRTIFLKYLKSGASASLPLSREARLAVFIAVTLLILIMIHSH